MNSKYLRMMITGSFTFCILNAALFISNAAACPNDPSDTPQPGPTHNEPGGGGGAPDPVFVMTPSMPSSSIVRIDPAPKSENKVSSVDEGRLAKSLAGIKDPSRAKDLACEAWRATVSLDLQRHALVVARSLAQTTADKQAFDFMLAALNDPTTEQEKCFRLGRGNGLEKSLAAERLAVLLQNPNLKERLK